MRDRPSFGSSVYVTTLNSYFCLNRQSSNDRNSTKCQPVWQIKRLLQNSVSGPGCVASMLRAEDTFEELGLQDSVRVASLLQGEEFADALFFDVRPESGV